MSTNIEVELEAGAGVFTHEDQLGVMVEAAGQEGYAACGCPPSAWDRIYYALQACFPDATDEQHRLATDFIVESELLP